MAVGNNTAPKKKKKIQGRTTELDGEDLAKNFDLFGADVICGRGHGAFHGNYTEDLEEMVLENIADNAKLVKVTAATLAPKFFGDDSSKGVKLVVEPECQSPL